MVAIDESLESLRQEAAQLRKQLARRLVSQGKACRARLLHYPDFRALRVAFPVLPEAERGTDSGTESAPPTAAQKAAAHRADPAASVRRDGAQAPAGAGSPSSSNGYAGGVATGSGASRVDGPGRRPTLRTLRREALRTKLPGAVPIAKPREILPCRECGGATFVGELAPGTYALFDAVGRETGQGFRVVPGCNRPTPLLAPATGPGTRFTLHWPTCPRLCAPRREDGRGNVAAAARPLRDARQAAAPPISRSSFCRTRSGSTTGLAR